MHLNRLKATLSTAKHASPFECLSLLPSTLSPKPTETHWRAFWKKQQSIMWMINECGRQPYGPLTITQPLINVTKRMLVNEWDESVCWIRMGTSCHNIHGLVALKMMSLIYVGSPRSHAGQGEIIRPDRRDSWSKVTITKPHHVCKGHHWREEQTAYHQSPKHHSKRLHMTLAVTPANTVTHATTRKLVFKLLWKLLQSESHLM